MSVAVGALAIDDGDSDETTTRLSIRPALLAGTPPDTLVAAGVLVGDRVTLTYKEISTGDLSQETTYITEVADPSAPGADFLCTVYPEITSTTHEGFTHRIPSWVIDRTSVSFALREAKSMTDEAQALKDLVANYTVDSSTAIDNVIAALVEQGMDRAVDLLLDGEIEEFFGMDMSDSSYAARAKAAIQTAGQLLLED